MTKFHINKHGVPAPCRAKAGNCPLGGDETHFNTLEDAQEHADEMSEQKHGLLPGVEGEDPNDYIDKSSPKKHGKSKSGNDTLTNKVISGEDYDANLLGDNYEPEDVDLSPVDLESSESIGFTQTDKIKDSDVYDKSLVNDMRTPEVDLDMEELGNGIEEGFITID